ncbi:MAG: IS1182 family transposase, partial [Cytophagales bacterium]
MEELVSRDNPVRFVDAFVDKLDLAKLGFAISKPKTEGRPSFEPKIFLKLYFYGYLNGIRSSRRLERECSRNIELQWLLSGLVPNYHTIADFRKDNPVALKNTFRLFVLFLKDLGLVGGETVAIDGTKIRASNSKKNNHNAKKIERHLAYIDAKTAEYMSELDKNDQAEKQPEEIKNIQEKLQRLKGNRLKYELLQQQLEESGQTQVSTTDPDARALLVQGQVVEVSYNTQAAVDSKHCLVVGTQTLNQNDRNALSGMAKEAKANIQSEGFTALADKGYHNGREIQQTQAEGIQTLVATPEVVNSNEKGTTKAYMAEQFVYDKETDTYTCPEGSVLKTTGNWHVKSRERDSYRMKKYRTSDCKTCPARNLCTAKADGRREIERSEYAEAVERNKINYLNNSDLYRKRQEINEHIFGTIKRQWGYNHTNLRGLSKVRGEMALVMTVYNMKRVLSILGFDQLIEKLGKWVVKYP